MFKRNDLPPHKEDWVPIFLGTIGSPDPNGRQLDGLGGGISSLSKICIVGPSSRADADVDYTFVQASTSGFQNIIASVLVSKEEIPNLSLDSC